MCFSPEKYASSAMELSSRATGPFTTSTPGILWAPLSGRAPVPSWRKLIRLAPYSPGFLKRRRPSSPPTTWQTPLSACGLKRSATFPTTTRSTKTSRCMWDAFPFCGCLICTSLPIRHKVSRSFRVAAESGAPSCSRVLLFPSARMRWELRGSTTCPSAAWRSVWIPAGLHPQSPPSGDVFAPTTLRIRTRGRTRSPRRLRPLPPRVTASPSRTAAPFQTPSTPRST